MSTKTMRLPPRRISSSNNASSNNTNTTTTKRKERESELNAPLLLQPTTTSSKSLKLLSNTQPACSGQLLAGYLAHEFLTKGTLLGQTWDPASTETETEEEDAVTVNVNVTERPAQQQQYERLERYVEVAALLKTDGAQLAGIVNPTQLARFLQL